MIAKVLMNVDMTLKSKTKPRQSWGERYYYIQHSDAIAVMMAMKPVYKEAGPEKYLWN